MRVHGSGCGFGEEGDGCPDHPLVREEPDRVVARMGEGAQQVRRHAGAVPSPHLRQHRGGFENLCHGVELADAEPGRFGVAHEALGSRTTGIEPVAVSSTPAVMTCSANSPGQAMTP